MAATVCALLPSVLARGVPEPRDEAPDAPVAPHVAVPRAALLAPLDVAELEAELLEALVAPDVVPQQAEVAEGLVAPDVAELQAELLEALVAPDVVPRRAEVPDASAEPGVLGQSVPVRDGLAALRAAGGPAELGAPDVEPQRAEALDGLAALGAAEAPAELGAQDEAPLRAERLDGLAAPGEVESSERVLDGPAMSFEGFVRVLGLAWPPFSSQKRADGQPEPDTAWQADEMLPGPPAALDPRAPQIARDCWKLRACVEPAHLLAESADHAPRPTPESWAWH
jgi:hypothetical protein